MIYKIVQDKDLKLSKEYHYKYLLILNLLSKLKKGPSSLKLKQ